MNKKMLTTLYVVGVLWMAVISQVVVSRLFMNDSRIMDAFTDTNTNIEESKLNLVVDYGNEFIVNSERKDVLNKLAKAVGLKNYDIKTETADGSSTMKIEEKTKDREVTIEFISIVQEQDEKETAYNHFVLLQLQLNQDFEDVIHYKKAVEKKVKNMKVNDYQCIMKFTGSYDGEMTEQQKDKKVKQVLKSLQAKRVESINSSGLYTIYAYTGLVEDYIDAAGKRININIAISYDEEEDKTEMYLATPILNEEY